MKEVITWSGLCENTVSLNKVNQITLYRFLLFTPGKVDDASTPPFKRQINCLVKKTVNDEWEPLPVSACRDTHCFLKSIPKLADRPSEELTDPPNFNYGTARIQP